MKTIFLFLFIACTLGVHAQPIRQWLSLTPIKIEKPVFGDNKNVKNNVFTDKMFLEYAGLNIRNLTPGENKSEDSFRKLQWSKARTNADTITAPENKEDYTLNYYAVYLSNSEWLQGTLNFKIFGNVEIYVDGIKKITVTDNKPVDKSITQEWIPGKHLILVKSASRGGNIFTANFKANKEFEQLPVSFSLSPDRGKNIYDVLNGKRISLINVSPSGKYAIVGIVNTVDGQNTYTTSVYRIADKEIVYSFYGNTVNNLQWIPDKDCLSFLRQEGKGNSLFTYDIEKQQQNCLICEDEQIKSFTWSPDQTYLIYYATENHTDPNWQLRKLDGIQDRQDYFRSRSYLCRFDFATGLHTRLTWGNLSTSLMDISHNGEQLLISTSYPDYKEYPFTRQSIYLLNIRTLKTDTLWKDRKYYISCQFSSDGQQLLISGGPSAFGKSGENIGKQPLANQYDQQLYIYDIASKKTEAISRHFNPSVEDATWHKDGSIYIKATDADFVRLYRYKDGQYTLMNIPGDMLLQSSISQNGATMMYAASNTNYPPRIYTLNLSDNKSVLWDDPQHQQYENIVFGEMKDWDYNYKKGTLIDGRYYLPADFDPDKKYPLIVYYYGGTTPVARSFGGRWPFNLYAANGYVVYVMQPSGTIGYGQEFSARHQNNWGKITADEIIASTKAFVKAHPFIDASKVGCMGASYGGFTTEYLTTRTDIFACAISHAGISSIAGYWGEGYWGYGYSTNASGHSYPWNRKDIYIDQSPLFNADKVHTPILLIHGTKDVNVPTGQSIQFYTALKLLGREAELVFVKDADHAVVDYQQRIIWNNTILSWFAKYLKGRPAWWEHQFKDLNL